MQSNRILSRSSAIACAFATAMFAGILGVSIPARADIDVHIDIGNAPPPPHIVFRAPPHQIYDRGTRVYVVDDPAVGDLDCFRYGGYYWLFTDGYWYRSRSWRGGFRVVQPRYVPTVFYKVPPTHWKHHPSGPPGLAKKPGGMPPGQMKQGGGPPGQSKKGESGHPGRPDQGDRGHDKQGGRGGK